MKSNLKNKPNKPWWIFSHFAGWRKLKKQPDIALQQKKSLNEQNVPSKASSTNNPNTINLTPDMEIIKITTIIEAIRKRQRNTQVLESTRNIQKIIGKKRSKRSPYESRKDSMTTRNLRYAREKKPSISNERSDYPKRYYRGQQKELLPRKHAADQDLRTANSVTMPSNVFYKRIWEYINGTRPHSDISSNYSFLENNSKIDNSTCIDNDGIASSPSRTNESQAICPNIKPERELYKRIWDLINATRSIHNAKFHSKRNVNIPKNKTLAATSTQLCTHEKKANHEEDKQTNKKSMLDITNMTDSQEVSQYDISGFWADVNKTKIKRQPETAISTENVKFNNNSISLSHASTASASEVEDLNKFPDKVESKIDHSSADNSTKNIDEVRDELQEISESTPLPYFARQENFTASNEYTDDNASQVQTKYAKNDSTDTTPAYDPSNIPYVEVPDYSDQREESLDKSDQNLTAANKEYDDNDYIDPEQKPPKFAEIKIQNTDDESDISHSRCSENSDSAECTDNVENIKLHEDDTSVQHSAEEDSAELARLSEERENSTEDFDINKYTKPFYLDYFINDNPILKSIKAEFDKENTKYKSEKSADYSESEEFEPYATYPKESYDYFTKNQDYVDHYGSMFNEKNKAKKNSDVYEKEETKDSEVSNEDHYSDDKDFLKHIFEEDNDKESSNMADAEKEFLSRYFTEDVLRQLKDNSTAEEDRRREKSKNREDIHKTLSKILDEKDRFSRLDENLNKMIKEGQTTPIRYKNFWSLEYELPRKKNKAEEESEA